MRFVVDTIACFGGGIHSGLRQMLQGNSADARALRGQVRAVFTQSTPVAPNFGGPFGTFYHTRLLGEILAGRATTWGQGVVAADVGGRLQGTDAHSLITVDPVTPGAPPELFEITMDQAIGREPSRPA